MSETKEEEDITCNVKKQEYKEIKGKGKCLKRKRRKIKL